MAGPRDEGGRLLCFTAGGDSPGPHRDRDPDSPGPHEPRDRLGLGSGRREERHWERLPRGREEAERPPVPRTEQGPGAEGAPGAGAATLRVPGGAEGSAEGQPPGWHAGDRGCLASPPGEGWTAGAPGLPSLMKPSIPWDKVPCPSTATRSRPLPHKPLRGAGVGCTQGSQVRGAGVGAAGLGDPGGQP